MRLKNKQNSFLSNILILILDFRQKINVQIIIILLMGIIDKRETLLLCVINADFYFFFNEFIIKITHLKNIW